jgi:hypothetical protein
MKMTKINQVFDVCFIGLFSEEADIAAEQIESQLGQKPK